jgi:SsrA-binding protein
MSTDYRIIATNRTAKRNYDIQDKFLAGVVLEGHEVKSARNGHVQLKGAYADFRGHELWLINAHIAPYPPAKLDGYEPSRSRKLLLHRQQLNQIAAARQNGLAIAVISIGRAGRLLKVELGVGRGRKKHDKRQVLKRRQADMEAAKAISARSRN